MPRLVYSLHFETERQPGAPIIGFVVPLDRSGNSPNFRPVGRPRVVDLRPGDSFVHGQAHGAVGIRQHEVSEERLAGGWKATEGYLVAR
jgi:hypothetical protein